MKDSLMLVLCDSLMADEYLPDGVRYERLRDAGESYQVCSIIESGASLMMPKSLCGEDYRASTLSLAKDIMEGKDKRLAKYFEGDPEVKVIAFNCARMISDCREEEQYPQVVLDRMRSPLIARHQTDYTMVDFEDVVQQRADWTKFPDLERCRFRHKPGLYGKDRIHIKRKVRTQATRELLKALRRTAMARYGQSLNDGAILLVILSGGNVEGTTFSTLDRDGKAWRRAEMLASTELCALNGHPASAFQEKIEELCKLRRGNHSRLLKMPIKAVPTPRVRKAGLKSRQMFRQRMLQPSERKKRV